MKNISAPMKLSNIPLVDRDEWILEKTKGKKVLHAGPTDKMMTEGRAAKGFLLHQKLKTVVTELVGVDIDKEGIRALREKHEICDIVHGDIEKLDEVFPKETFDVVLMADVLEHLSNPGLCLSSVKKILREQGELLITVPNAFSFKKFIGVALWGQERNHPEHTCFFSRMNLHQLLGRYDFEITEENSFLLVDPNRRKINVLANRVAFVVMKLLNHNIADEWAIAARVKKG